MKFFKAEQVGIIDQYTIENEPIPSGMLMERAAGAFCDWFIRKFDISNHILIVGGPGNNGGDAFAVARMLFQRNYSVSVCFLKFTEKVSDDCNENLMFWKKENPEYFFEIENSEDFPEEQENEVIIEGVFGSGLTRPVKGLPGEIIRLINKRKSRVVSIDIPSGLMGEGIGDEDASAVIHADHTVTFQFPFLSFFFAENYKYTGDWVVVSIGLHPDIINELSTDYSIISPDVIQSLIRERTKFSHKGTYGHALIIAGSYGMAGAAVLSASSCLRTGAGLTTIHIPRSLCDIIQVSVPEALTNVDKSDLLFTEIPDLSTYNAIAAGPGIGRKSNVQQAVLQLIEASGKPLVLDADALNILSENKDKLNEIPMGSVITPHPKEFDRLAGESRNGWERHLKQREFSEKYNLIVVLKGAYTIISEPSGNSWINMTGNPGMAKGGSGDVLTGMIVSLMAQNYSPSEAARLAVYLHGAAADLALECQSVESLIATDIIEKIGKAFSGVRKY